MTSLACAVCLISDKDASEVIKPPAYIYTCILFQSSNTLGDKKFDSVDELVEDGLITLYLQKHGVAEAMERGRHNTLARKSNAQSRLKRKHGK